MWFSHSAFGEQELHNALSSAYRAAEKRHSERHMRKLQLSKHSITIYCLPSTTVFSNSAMLGEANRNDNPHAVLTKILALRPEMQINILLTLRKLNFFRFQLKNTMTLTDLV